MYYMRHQLAQNALNANVCFIGLNFRFRIIVRNYGASVMSIIATSM